MNAIWITGFIANTNTVMELKKMVANAKAMAMFFPATP